MGAQENQENVGKWRKSKGFSQAALAEKIGVSQATASRIEAGEKPTEEAEKALRKMGYIGPLGPAPEPKQQGILDILDKVEAAMGLLAQRGIKPPNAAKAHELRKLVGKALERSADSPIALADEVEGWIRAAEAFRK